MHPPIRKIAISTGGGDAPGLNAVIRAATLTAIERGWEVIGITHGYRGLLEPTPDGLIPLTRDRVRGIVHVGGTILGTSNRGSPFAFPTRGASGEIVAQDRSEELVRRFHEEGFDALIAIGGDGSLHIANQLRMKGLTRIIGVPKTIDNDVRGTDQTFGFDSAVQIATEAIGRLHTTTEAHERVMAVEVMGRNAGWIALWSGLAGGADVILIPEVPFDYDRIAEKVMLRERRGRSFSIIVVAEGAIARGGAIVVRDEGDVFRGVVRLGGLAERVATEIALRTGKEARSIALGHLLRGGGPSTFDRLLALRYGAAAVRFLAGGSESGMVALRGGNITLVPLDEAANGTRTVPLDGDMMTTAREMGLCFGDESVARFTSP